MLDIVKRARSFHAPGSAAFLGLRNGRAGGVEIVYDDGSPQRQIWRVIAGDEARIAEAMRASVGARRVVPALCAALSQRAVAFEQV